MGTDFQTEVAAWANFYTLLGGAAAALLGLVFVALSLRLGIFRRHRDDIRDSAGLVFGSLLVAIGVAALMMAPNRDRASTAIILVLVAVAGVAAEVWVFRVMRRLWSTTGAPEPLTHGTPEWIVRHGFANVGLLVAAWLIWIGHEHGLGLLGFAEAYLLASGAVSAWLLLAHTANDPVDPAS
jgi:hypothetical protein